MELHVQFKERKLMKTKEEERLCRKLDMPKDVVRKMLVNGTVVGETDRCRMITGEAAKHVVCWKTYTYSLTPASTEKICHATNGLVNAIVVV